MKVSSSLYSGPRAVETAKWLIVLQHAYTFPHIFDVQKKNVKENGEISIKFWINGFAFYSD